MNKIIEGECYSYKDFNKRNEITNQGPCFSSFNRRLISNELIEASIIFSKEKLEQKPLKDIKYFLRNIKHFCNIDFSFIKQDDIYIIRFNKLKNLNLSELKIFGMVVRCLYLTKNDDFRRISFHFINMCRFFPKKDRGMLFTIACNLFIQDVKKARCSGGMYSLFNSNHILMLDTGCKIINSETIKNNVSKLNYINSYFSSEVVLDFEEYDLEICNKKNYLKIIEKNGIK